MTDTRDSLQSVIDDMLCTSSLSCQHANDECKKWADRLTALQSGAGDGVAARPLDEYHEDMGYVTWWAFPVIEPSWIGSPNCDDWPGYHTHFTPHPAIPSNHEAIDKTIATQGHDMGVVCPKSG